MKFLSFNVVRSALLAVVVLAIVGAAACGSSPVITTTSLPNGVVGQAYSTQLQGTDVDSWSLSSGALPDGLALSTSGAITGTPTTAGTFTFTVAASGSSSTDPSATASFTITITAS